MKIIFLLATIAKAGEKGDKTERKQIKVTGIALRRGCSRSGVISTGKPVNFYPIDSANVGSRIIETSVGWEKEITS